MKKMNHLLMVVFVSAAIMSFKTVNSYKLKEAETLKIDIEKQNGWGSWQTTDCFRGLDLRVKKKPKSSYSEKHEWLVQFRNRYNEKINFNFEIVPYSERSSIRQSQRTTNRTSLKANTSEKNSHYRYLYESNRVYVHVNRVRFGKDYGKGYANCDH